MTCDPPTGADHTVTHPRAAEPDDNLGESNATGASTPRMQRPKGRAVPLVDEVWLYDVPASGYNAVTGELFGPPEFVAEVKALLRGEQP